LKLQRTGRIAVATLAVVAALGMSACGSGDKHSSSNHKTMTTSAAAEATTTTGNYPPTPTVAQLNKELAETLNPNVPAAQKVQYLQNGSTALQKDPQMINKLITAYQQNNAKISVTDVKDTGTGSLTASANFSINGGQNNVAVVPFVAQDGAWKLSLDWACNGLKNLNQNSPACT
jgi:ABC-type oligopeptide transport system substrate-binding subunit